ncbi:bleomycin resistance protein [Streptococcus varani]|uniref:Bleomycin resistance protein n=1 Tax=Streptococcus varani TaxID=1608583 RepID=A0A0E4H7P5_9STRE|nr:VOC family protein [Streptococcus varani]CQR24672.1 bleomycin resistance protein [Streptococcus varani]
MVKAIELYLVTDNNGLEAVNFYKNVFQAEVLACTTYGQAIPNTPEEKKDLLLNACLSIDGIRLQISDNGPDFPYVAGTNMTACLQLDSAQEAKELYEKLTVDAENIGLELQETPWSPAYANFTDKFGMNWQINADIPGFVSESVNF